ncbi:hypothetical protein ES703_118706 [subsurface metagenome]
MAHICEICGRDFKSASGLVGHKRLKHGEIAKPDTPNDHVLAEALESAIDSLGEHRDLLADVQATLGSVSTKLDGFQRALTPPDGHNPPSMELVDVWERCPSCSPKWSAMKEPLFARLHDDLFPTIGSRESIEHIKKFEEEHSEKANPERSENSGEAKMQRWQITRAYPGRGFKWSEDRELYYFETEDERLVEEYRGKKGIQVLELEE